MKTTRIISALWLLASWCYLDAMVAYGQIANTNQFPAKTNSAERLSDGLIGTVLAVAQDTKTIALVSGPPTRTDDGRGVVYEVTPETKIFRRGEPAALQDAVVGDEIRYLEGRSGGGGVKPMLKFLELKPTGVVSGTYKPRCPTTPSNRLAGDPPLKSTVDCNECHTYGRDKTGTVKGQSQMQFEACLGRLKYIALSARVWATNHNGFLPSDFASMNTSMHYRLTSTALLFCNLDTTNRPPASWAEFNPAKTPYQLVSPGTGITNSSAVYIRCSIHDHALLVDGSVVAAKAKR